MLADKLGEVPIDGVEGVAGDEAGEAIWGMRLWEGQQVQWCSMKTKMRQQ